MRVLVTGGCGNLGANAIGALCDRGHAVRCFDRPTRANVRSIRRLGHAVETVWGDLRHGDSLAQAVDGVDVVIHLAFVLPPATDEDPATAEAVNVGGTRRLLAAMHALGHAPKLIFSSSLTVFGDTQHLEPPRRVTDPVRATDPYTRHKLECEALCAASGLDWCVLRFAVVPPISLGGVTSKMFAFPYQTRLEFLDPRDAGLALAKAAESTEVWGKLLLVGGGPDCQLRYGDFVGRMMETMGVGRLPEEAFGADAAYTDWLDTTESERLLGYQRHSFEAFVRELPRMMGPVRHLVPLVRPLARWFVLRQSPYLRSHS